MLDWIPAEVWESVDDADSGSIVDVILIAWSFFCVGLAAFPVGIFTGCMGATHFLHKQGRDPSIVKSLKLVLPRSWCLWVFHWVDGWITVNQIVDRLPGEDDDNNDSSADKAAREALYYAWKIGVSGILPSIVMGDNLFRSAKNSIVFVKDKFMEVAKLRAGYSILCWIVGIAAYLGAILFFGATGIVGQEHEALSKIYKIYLWAAVPIVIAVGVVVVLLRPVFVIAMCDLYSDHLRDTIGMDEELPEHPESKTGKTALYAFGVLCVALAIVFVFRQELGIMELLSTPYPNP